MSTTTPTRATQRAATHRSLHCAVCDLHKHDGCQCEAPELREVASEAELHASGDYYVIETRLPPRQYFDRHLKLRTAHDADRFLCGVVRHACGRTEPVAARGTVDVLRANCVQAIQRGCRCRRGFACNGQARPVEELAKAA